MTGDSGTGSPINRDVKFEWTETLPGEGTCTGGLFVGRFTCPISNAPIPSTLDGTIVLDLAGPNERQLLETTGGILTVPLDPNVTNSLSATVTGRAECTARLFAGDIPSTMLTTEQTGFVFSLAAFLFCSGSNTLKGSMVGSLDRDGQSLYGDLAMEIGTCACSGTFDLRAQR